MLCFRSMPQVQSGQNQGMYWLDFEQVLGKPVKGQLSLPEQGRVSWQIKRQGEGLQLGLVALQPLRGLWYPLEDQPCVKVQVTAETHQ